jgi:tyrosyl-tRNA synthetase
MMKKFMQLPDAVMRMYFELLTDLPMAEVDTLLAGHPRDAKLALGRTITGQYHSEADASAAADRWVQEVAGHALPESIEQASVPSHLLDPDGTVQAAKLLVLTKLCATSSDARRTIAQGGAYCGEALQRIAAHDQKITIETGLLLKVGKKRLCRVTLDQAEQPVEGVAKQNV